MVPVRTLRAASACASSFGVRDRPDSLSRPLVAGGNIPGGRNGGVSDAEHPGETINEQRRERERSRKLAPGFMRVAS
jgi:hypothetical protein